MPIEFVPPTGERTQSRSYGEEQRRRIKQYEDALAHIETTFYLEPHVPPDGKIEAIVLTAKDIESVGLSNYRKMTPEQNNVLIAKLLSLPFPCIRIIEEIRTVEDGVMTDRLGTETICAGDGNHFWWAVRYHNYISGETTYSPIRGNADDIIPPAYLHFLETTANNSARYPERPVSRQVRRRYGFAEGYKEYIVIRKPNKEQRKTMPRLSEIFRRHPRLHAVRGHLRHYRTGLVTHVRAHARGKGTMLQVKDYITEEAYYSGA